jgi:hypothetical protein
MKKKIKNTAKNKADEVIDMIEQLALKTETGHIGMKMIADAVIIARKVVYGIKRVELKANKK